MREDTNDYSITLNSDLNSQNFKIKETAEENCKIENLPDANPIIVEDNKDKTNEKIYNPPDINKIKAEENKNKINEKKNIYNSLVINKAKFEENLDEKDEKIKTNNLEKLIEIKQKSSDKKDEKKEENDFEFIAYQFFNNTGLIEYFVDSVRVLRKGKTTIMNLFTELRKKRIIEIRVSKHEKILLEKILILFKEQLLKDYKKMKEKDGKEVNIEHLFNNENSDETKTDNNEEVLDDNTDKDVMEILANVKIESVYNDTAFDTMQDILADDKFKKILNISDNISEEKMKEMNNFINNFSINKKDINNNNNNNINSSKDSLETIYNVCFKKDENSYYEGLKLQNSFIFYIIQNFLFLASFISISKPKETDDYISGISAVVILALCAVYIFWKLFYRKYDESFTEKNCWIIFHLFNLFLLKSMLYLYLFIILVNVIQDEYPNKIFYGYFSIENVFLLYCAIYFCVRDGLISYATLTLFGIAILTLSILFSMIGLFLKDVLILLIMCVVAMIFFHLGINIARCKGALLKNKKLWNTLSIEVFQLTIILFPTMIATFVTLIFITIGYFMSLLR